MKLCLDHDEFTRKPSGAEIGKISKRIAEHCIEISLEDFVKQITEPNGRTYTPAWFNGNARSNDAWAGQQIFGLDFDGGITYKEIMARCKEYNIIPSVIYETFSSVDRNKLRVLFVCEQEITDFRIRTAVQIALLTMFKESDKSCKDASRLFFGGKAIVYKDYNARFNPVNLILEMTRYIKDNDKNENSAREIKKYCETVGLNIINGMPKITEITEDDMKIDGSAAHPISIYKGEAAKPSKIAYGFYFTEIQAQSKDHSKGKHKVTHEKIQREYLRRFDFNKLQEDCRLWREFSCGQYWAYHNELSGMAMNVLWIKGGREAFITALAQNEDKYDLNKWEYYCNYFVKVDYQPMNCDRFCPYVDECEHGLNMIDTVKTARGTVTVLDTPELITLTQGEVRLKEAFQRAIEVKDRKVYVIKAPTGIGKTELYLGLKNVTIALPTHKLKYDVARRMRERDYSVTVMPELPKATPEIEEEIRKLYDTGAYAAANSYIRNLAEKEKMPEYIEYLKALRMAQSSTGTLLTTHERLLLVKDNNDTIIVDEDIFPSLLQVNSIKLNDLQKVVELSKTSNSFGKLQSILTKVHAAGLGLVEEMPSFFLKNRATLESLIISNNCISTNIIGFLNCSHFVKERIEDEVVIYFSTKRELPQKKIIIMSATANEMLYKLLLGDRVEFIDIGTVETVGVIHQYPQRSFSRYQMREDKTLLAIAKAIVEDKPVITYKEHEREYPNVIATFGATAGLDTFSGKDIYVVGTPHNNPVTYLLIANALGKRPRFNDCKTSLEYQLIKRNGFQFYFNTFSEDDVLREIQLAFIESELIQAIGRARILRNECKVVVLSNLPIQGAKFVYLTKEEIARLLEMKN